MSAITLLIHLVGGILGGLKVGRENNFFWCLVWVIWGRKIDGYECFSFWAHQNVISLNLGKKNRRKSVAKMLRKKKRTILAPWWSIVLLFFFLVWLFHFSFLFPKVGASRKCTACTFFGFLKNWARLFFIFCLLIFLFSF